MAALETASVGRGYRAVHPISGPGWWKSMGGEIHEKCYLM
jgi:hypothetical protein